MSNAQRRLFMGLLVALVVLLAVMLAAPISDRELRTGTTWRSGPGDLVEVRDDG